MPNVPHSQLTDEEDIHPEVTMNSVPWAMDLDVDSITSSSISADDSPITDSDTSEILKYGPPSFTVVNLPKKYSTPISVYSPLTRYHHLEETASTSIKSQSNKAKTHSRTAQLSVSSTWRSLQVYEAEALYAMQEAFRTRLSKMVQEKVLDSLWDIYAPGNIADTSRAITRKHTITFCSDGFVMLMARDLYHLLDDRLAVPYDCIDLVLLYLRSCDCVHESLEDEDAAIDVSLFNSSQTQDYEIEVETKLDSLSFELNTETILEGSILEITPVYHCGGTFARLPQLLDFDLYPPIQWLQWNGSSWVGIVPTGASSYSRLEIKVRAKSVERAGNVSLERIVRASISLKIEKRCAKRASPSGPTYIPAQKKLQLKTRVPDQEITCRAFSPTYPTARFDSMPAKPTQQSTRTMPPGIGYFIPPCSFGHDEWDLGWFGRDMIDRRRYSVGSDVTLGLISDSDTDGCSSSVD